MNIETTMIKLLNNRGIYSQEDIEEFLSEKPQKTYNPFLLHNMEAGVDLILSQINANKRICIYGDYDADGVTSTTILLNVLSYLTSNITYYIPSRFDEGYGLNMEAIDTIKKQNIDMIITVDCGSVSYNEVEYAKKLGLQILVTDHHTITDTIADCLVINPKQKDCTYPFKELAGCGIAFKLAQGISKKTDIPRKALTEILDLVGIGTIGDIVPLVDENRTLAKYGLRAINLGGRLGLDTLMEKISLIRGKVRSEDVSFGIVPHINAAGRMVDAKLGVQLLTSTNIEKIQLMADKMVEQNSQRKKIQEDTYKEAVEIIETLHRNDNFLVVLMENAHEGITGIVAGKVKDLYNKPTIIVTPSGDGYKGTGRSIDNIDIYSLLKDHEELFTKFGGHSAACGFSMKKENLEKLRVGLNQNVAKILEGNPMALNKSIYVDMEVTISQLTEELADQIELIAPFGCKNTRPVFRVPAVELSAISYMGAEKNHVRFLATDEFGKKIQCVLFGKAKEYDTIMHSLKKHSLVGKFECQLWNGAKKLQLIVEDIEV
ncbi:MAG: single-stranded-DNA-specific exonuclease RecJ [Anaerovoracaceae bacterium]